MMKCIFCHNEKQDCDCLRISKAKLSFLKAEIAELREKYQTRLDQIDGLAEHLIESGFTWEGKSTTTEKAVVVMKAQAEGIERLKKELRGWHHVVIDCERAFRLEDTAESPLTSNLANICSDKRIEIERLQALEGKTDHPEHKCQRCGGRNINWYANNNLWNEVNGSPNGILCPICFAEMAEAKWKEPTTWQLSREGDAKVQAKEIERLKGIVRKVKGVRDARKA